MIATIFMPFHLRFPVIVFFLRKTNWILSVTLIKELFPFFHPVAIASSKQQTLLRNVPVSRRSLSLRHAGLLFSLFQLRIYTGRCTYFARKTNLGPKKSICLKYIIFRTAHEGDIRKCGSHWLLGSGCHHPRNTPLSTAPCFSTLDASHSTSTPLLVSGLVLIVFFFCLAILSQLSSKTLICYTPAFQKSCFWDSPAGDLTT